MGHIWKPVEGLSAEDKAIDVSEFMSLSNAWQDVKARLGHDDEDQMNAFQKKLRRSWSIETGILENLYMIDRGTTETMLDKGFHQELISRSSNVSDPARLIKVLRDHLEASEMLVQAIADEDDLTIHFVRQLHALITRHQDTVEAQDFLGKTVDVPLLRGEWKKWPNSRIDDDGEPYEYCPPEQVQGEMEDLLAKLETAQKSGVNVAIVAAWFHHRFVLIHPFQDGNGRVGRALVNFLFVKEGLFPVVVYRDEKADYLDALDSANAGKLEALTGLMAGRQVDAIKQALSIARGEDLARSNKVRDLAGGLLQRLELRREREVVQYRQVDDVIERLWSFAGDLLDGQLNEFRQELEDGGLKVNTNLDKGGSFDDRAYWYRGEVVDSARQAENWANFEEQTRWIRALVESRSTRLRFIVSFHHIGRQLTGVAEATSIADLEIRSEESDPSNEVASRASLNCMERPFSLTWRDEPEDLIVRFEAWLEECFVIALRSWSDTL